MHITILALGSRGDIQPYIALGRGLKGSGHQVKVATFESFRSVVEGQGLDLHPVKGDAQRLLQVTAGIDLMESGQNPFRMMRQIQKTYGALVDDYIESFSADSLRKTDAIINQLPAALFGYDLAECLDVPHLIASVIPLVPTRVFPLSLIATRSLGPVLNRLSYTFAGQMAWQTFRPAINRFRKRLGLRPAGVPGPAGQIEKRRDLVLNGFSKHVVPPPPDWGPNVHTTGYWILDETGWQPPDDLLRFLDAGEKPVFVGFGSMPIRDPQATTRLVVQALERSGQRGILSSGWAELGNLPLPETIYRLDYAPYAWLLPRMASAVIHGGSGTTGLCLRAGIPTLIVPFVADQPYWGKRLHDLGVGPSPVPYKKLSVDSLASAISTAVQDAGMRQQAVDLGIKLRAENGLAEAVRLVNEHLQQKVTHP